MVDRRKLTTELSAGIVQTADALRLKAPAGKQIYLDPGEAIVIRLARNKQDLRACLGLRFQVYNRLFYLEERIANNPAKIEMDCYDFGAIHLLAEHHLTGEIVGTVRLVLQQRIPETLVNSAIGSPARTIKQQAEMCREIALHEAAMGNLVLLEKLNESKFAALPILQSNDFRDKTPEVLSGARSQVELSRLVIRPRFRALRISQLLIRAVIAVAHDLKRDTILLECIPFHAPMYEKYGFKRMIENGHHGRDQDLDQMAVAMCLQLTGSPFDRIVSLAHRDLEMIRGGSDDPAMLFGAKHLCMCEHRECWSSGTYSSRHMASCPLLKLHKTLVPKRG